MFYTNHASLRIEYAARYSRRCQTIAGDDGSQVTVSHECMYVHVVINTVNAKFIFKSGEAT